MEELKLHMHTDHTDSYHDSTKQRSCAGIATEETEPSTEPVSGPGDESVMVNVIVETSEQFEQGCSTDGHTWTALDRRSSKRTSARSRSKRNKIVTKSGICKHECENCGRNYKSKHGLSTHQKSCMKVGKCAFCERMFKDESELELHQQSHENGTFKCIMCDYTNPQWSQVKSHMETHNRVMVNECEDCGMSFASALALKNHRRFHHLGGRHLCDECGFEVSSRYMLFQHRTKCHLALFSCSQCRFACDNQVELDEHVSLRHRSGFNCKHCDPVTRHASYEELTSHMNESHSGKKCYVCDKCNYVAKLKHQLEKHYLMHTGERPVKCSVQGCSYSTRDKTNFKRHMLTKHGNPGDLACRQCRFVTSNQNEMDIHMAMHHMKVYKCDKCPFKTGVAACLRRHRLAKHVSEESIKFPCPHCQYKTNFRDCFNKHLLTHVLRNSRHKCVFCKVILNSREELKSHLSQSHPKNAGLVRFCEICPYSCQRAQVLEQHVLTHGNSKNHKCDFCEYSARTKAGLKAHLLRKHPSNQVDQKHCTVRESFSDPVVQDDSTTSIGTGAVGCGPLCNAVTVTSKPVQSPALQNVCSTTVSYCDSSVNGLSILSDAARAEVDSINSVVL